MKKRGKAVLGVAVAMACLAGAAAFTGCATTKDVTGEYHYANQWSATSPDYGIKVNVTVQSDGKGDRIRKVTVADSDYVSASDGWDGKSNWESNLQTLLNAYRGKYVWDVLSKEVAVSSSGAPETSDSSAFVSYGGDLLTTGATQSSGRLLLAVQDALMSFYGYDVAAVGEYHYNQYGTEYGVKVKVFLKENVIAKVVVLDSGYCNATDMESGDWKPSNWTEKEQDILNAYVGKTVAEITAATATVSGQNGAEANSVSDGDLLVTGATMSSARLLLAVQNALSQLN